MRATRGEHRNVYGVHKIWGTREMEPGYASPAAKHRGIRPSCPHVPTAHLRLQKRRVTDATVRCAVLRVTAAELELTEGEVQ